MMDSTILKESFPKARKQHQCMTCLSTIDVGENYHRDSLASDGRVYDWVSCQACMDDAVVNWVVLDFDPDFGAQLDENLEWAEWASEEDKFSFQRRNPKQDAQRMAVAKRFLERYNNGQYHQKEGPKD